MNAFTFFAKHVYYPLLDLQKGSLFTRYLAQAELNQYLAPSELEALQVRKLRAILSHAEATCRFYGERFRVQKLRAADLQSVADIRRFPLLSKEQVHTHHEHMISSSPDGKLFRATTSGSTGIALRFHIDSAQYAWA